MNTNANEPAYPFTPTDKSGQIGPSAPGITKREAAAIAAMQGLLAAQSSASNTSALNQMAKENGLIVTEVIARASIEYADALLFELSKPQTP